MVWKRVAYAIFLALSVLAFIFTDSGVALFFCLSFAALPILSLIMLAIAKSKLKFDFEVRPSCIRGGALQITVRAKVFPRFLIGYVRATAEIDNTTFCTTEHKNILFKDLSFKPHTFEYVGKNSGRIFVRFTKIKLIDIFGICSVGVKCGKYAESSITPVLYEDINARLSSNSIAVLSGEMALPQKGNDHTEIYAVRDYVAGDPLNSVHWKLSGKFDSLVTKEYGSSDDRQVLILVDLSRNKYGHAASDEQLNGVLDAAISLSDSLKGEVRHTVGHFTDGEFACSEVYDSDTFVEMVNELMSIKVDKDNGESMFYYARDPMCSAFTQVILVTSYVDEHEFKTVGEHVTVISVGDESGELDEGSVKIINVPYNGIAAALTGCEL